MSEVTWEQLNLLIDEDPIELRDVAWAEIQRLTTERDAVIDALADALGMEDGADHWSQLTAQAAAIKASEEEASDEIRRLTAERDEALARAKGIHLVCHEAEVTVERDEARAELADANATLGAAIAEVEQANSALAARLERAERVVEAAVAIADVRCPDCGVNPSDEAEPVALRAALDVYQAAPSTSEHAEAGPT